MAAELTRASIVCATSQQVSSRLADEVVILNLKDGTYYSLEEVGALIWDRMQQPCSIAQLCAAVMAEYEVEADQCAEDVLALVDDLLLAGMIEVQHVASASISEPAAR
jgi:hypothetical protein